MRFQQPDDHAIISAEIKRLKAQAGEESSAEDDLDAELRAALSRDEVHFSETKVRRLRQDLARVRERRAILAERIAAKQAQLPNAAERKAGEAEAKRLTDELRSADQRHATDWETFLAAVDPAEDAAREVLAVRASASQLRARLRDLVARLGLKLEVPVEPEAPNAKVAYLAGLFVSQAALGEPDDVVVRDLAAARRKVAS